jgi:hypothetical protein
MAEGRCLVSNQLVAFLKVTAEIRPSDCADFKAAMTVLVAFIIICIIGSPSIRNKPIRRGGGG